MTSLPREQIIAGAPDGRYIVSDVRVEHARHYNVSLDAMEEGEYRYEALVRTGDSLERPHGVPEFYQHGNRQVIFQWGKL